MSRTELCENLSPFSKEIGKTDILGQTSFSKLAHILLFSWMIIITVFMINNKWYTYYKNFLCINAKYIYKFLLGLVRTSFAYAWCMQNDWWIIECTQNIKHIRSSLMWIVWARKFMVMSES